MSEGKLSEELQTFIEAPPSFQARVMNLDLLTAWADRIAALEYDAETARLIEDYWSTVWATVVRRRGSRAGWYAGDERCETFSEAVRAAVGEEDA